MAALQPQMKAPQFKGTAVVGGQFKEVTASPLLLSLFFIKFVFINLFIIYFKFVR